MTLALLFVALVVPLALDTFGVAAVLGIAGLPRADRMRVALILSGFEAGMPIIGALAGAAAGPAIGAATGYLAAALLAVAGLLGLREGAHEVDEQRRLELLGRARGFAIVGLGIAVSVDELTIGLSAGLLGMSLLLVVIWIAVQGFAAAQLGVAVGSRIGAAGAEAAERGAGLVLLGAAIAVAILTWLGRL